jgi:hypothetical protein
MARVLFPTSNDIGVRTMSGETLGADYDGFRAPAEPAPRGASNPVTLGVASNVREFSENGTTYWGGRPIVDRPPVLPVRTPTPIQPVGPIVAVPKPPPVSQQTTPTPVVSVPPSQPAPPLITSGGGTASPNIAPTAPVSTPIIYTTDPSGNIVNARTGAIAVPAAQAVASGVSAASMNAAAAPAASAGVTEQIAAWLGGSTAIGSYSVPNALLAAAVVLGFAWLEGGSSSSTGRKR